MASFVFNKGREGFLDGDIDWAAANNIKVAIVTSGYAPNSSSTNQFLSDVTNIIGTSANLASKTSTNGTADAADIAISSVTGAANALVVYQDTGVAGTSRLICYIDSVTGFPATVTGATITIQWNASGIFTL